MKFFTLINSVLNRRDRQFLVLLFVLSIIVSLLETVSISAIMLFISVCTNVNVITSNAYVSIFYTWLGCTTPKKFILLFGLILIAFYCIRAVMTVGHIYLMSRFAYTRYHRFATLLFSRFIRFSYEDFCLKNSAILNQSIFSNTGLLSQLLFGTLTFFAELFTILCVYTLLFFVNFKMTLVLSIILGVKAFVLIRLFSKSISSAGKAAHYYSVLSNKILNESVGNFKLIKLGGFEEQIAHRVSVSTKGFGDAQITFITLQNSPRFFLETIGFFLLIVLMLFVMYTYNDASSIIPIVSLYALAFYRLLPSLNKLLSSVNQITFSYHALQGVCDFLKLPTEEIQNYPVHFNQTVIFSNVCFEYQKDKQVLNNLSLTINKGERIGIIGPSGSGKSTMIDLLMGLYEPTQGVVLVDHKSLDKNQKQSWRRKIGYIPQTIYLFDGTVEDNIVFGRSYNRDKIIDVLQKSHMYAFLQTQQGLKTLVGEGGIKLSGGQRQRIAIARALYADPEILVLDEATSALDTITESHIMNEIYQLGRSITLIIVAHRVSTTDRCDRIFLLEQGHIVSQKSLYIPDYTRETTVT